MTDRLLHNPRTGETIKFLTTSQETNGELFRMGYTMAPHAAIADEHSHPYQEMIIRVRLPTIAPKKGISDNAAPASRENTFRLSCIAPMLGAPEISMPLAKSEGCPIGLSLMGPKNGDRMLLHAVTEVARLML